MKIIVYGIGRVKIDMQIDEGRIVSLVVKDVERANLISKDWAKRILKKLVNVLGMKAISQPSCVVYRDPEDSSKDGVSGIVIIAESHISIHAWIEDKAIDITCNSCRDFSINKLVEFCKEEFFTENVKVNVNYKKGE